ncbi:hypothetical protein H0H93_002353 [Arthromyces matolae]|nr:hypothetical protein H0H93_002353 [Arthromyces matolae]
MSSADITPNDSPMNTPIQPLHDPSKAAHVVVPQAPLGNVANQDPSLGARALLAKRLAKIINPTFVSPTDNLVTPVTQKLNATKMKQFSKGPKPVQLFAQQPASNNDSDDEQMDDVDATSTTIEPKEMTTTLPNDDENPF